MFLKCLSPLGKSSTLLGRGYGKVSNHSAMSWAESRFKNGFKNLAIAHGRAKDYKNWGRKHLVTNGIALCLISHTGAAQ